MPTTVIIADKSHKHGATPITDLGEESALCVVQRFSESDFSRIKSIPGFLRGIIRRVRQDGPDRGEGKVDSLPRSVRHQLEDLFEDVRLVAPVALSIWDPRSYLTVLLTSKVDR